MSGGYTSIGPWIGVPPINQRVCAVEGCKNEGAPQVCPWDGRLHHHGCIHYDCEAAKPAVERAKLKFREGGWALMCDEHYALLDEPITEE